MQLRFRSLNQYLASPASFEAMAILEIKSLFDCAALASSTFAPMLVPHVNSCCDITYSRFSVSVLHNETIRSAKSKLNSAIEVDDCMNLNSCFGFIQQ